MLNIHYPTFSPLNRHAAQRDHSPGAIRSRSGPSSATRSPSIGRLFHASGGQVASRLFPVQLHAHSAWFRYPLRLLEWRGGGAHCYQVLLSVSLFVWLSVCSVCLPRNCLYLGYFQCNSACGFDTQCNGEEITVIANHIYLTLFL